MAEADRYRAIAFKKAADALTAANFKITPSNLELAGQLPSIGKGTLAQVGAMPARGGEGGECMGSKA